MMDTLEQIQSLEQEHREELETLKKKAEAEAKEAEDKKQAELEQIKLHGRNDAINALIACDPESYYLEDEKLFMRVGDERVEICVDERFEKSHFRFERGKSIGFWYSISDWRSKSPKGFVDKSRQWKKPESAHKSLAELRDVFLTAKKYKENQAVKISEAIKTLKARYPKHDVSQHYTSNQINVEHSNGCCVSYYVHDDDIRIKDVEISSKAKSDVAEYVLSMPDVSE